MTDIQRIENRIDRLTDTVTLQGQEMAALTAMIKTDMEHRKQMCAEHGKIIFGNGKGRINDRVDSLEKSRDRSQKTVTAVAVGTIMAIIGAVISWFKTNIGG